jgi:hypothetical protein
VSPERPPNEKELAQGQHDVILETTRHEAEQVFARASDTEATAEEGSC